MNNTYTFQAICRGTVRRTHPPPPLAKCADGRAIRSLSERDSNTSGTTRPVHVTAHMTVHLFSSSLERTAMKLVVTIKNIENAGDGAAPRAATHARGNFPLTNFVGREERRRKRGGRGGGAGERPLQTSTSPPPHASTPSRTSWVKNAVASSPED